MSRRLRTTLYAPGLRARRQVVVVVEAVAPKPVNLLVGPGWVNELTLSDIVPRRLVSEACNGSVYAALFRVLGDFAPLL